MLLAKGLSSTSIPRATFQRMSKSARASASASLTLSWDWRLSNTRETDFCVEALQEALGQGRPQVFNTDQGSQFTSGEFIQTLQEHRVKISMDGKGRHRDNILVEGLWRTVKYEEVYLKAYANASEALQVSHHFAYSASDGPFITKVSKFLTYTVWRVSED